MKRKIINISVATSIFCTSIIGSNASAASFGDSVDYGDYGASFVGKVSNDGNSIMYAVGGKYRLKMQQRAPQAWFNVQPPSATLGCAGMSFKGMFMSLLNISQIGDQLKDAGAAFAWGIILGLVTSLPGIKEVFDTINKWANQIQSLLANACNIGKKLASESQFKADMDNAFEKKAKDFKESNSWVGEAQRNAGNVAGFISYELTAAQDWASSSDTKEDREGTIFDMIKTMFGHPGYMSNIVKTASRTQNVALTQYMDGIPNVSDSNQIGVFLDPGQLSIKANPTGFNNGETANWQFKVIAGLVASNLIGRVATTEEHTGKIKAFIEIASDAIQKGGGDPEAVKQAIEDVAAAMPKAEEAKEFVPPKLSENDISDWILEGTFPANLEMPKMVGYVTPAKSTGKPKMFFADSLSANTLTASTGWGAVFNKYGKVKELAQKQVACITRSSAGNVTYGSVANCSTLPPVLLPSAQKYMKIYSQSLSEDQEEVKEALAIYLSALWLDALMAEIDSNVNIVLASANTGSTVNSGPGAGGNNKALPTGFDQKTLNSEREAINTMMKKLKEKLNITPAEISEIKKFLDGKMKDLEATNAKRGIGASSR